MAPAACRRKYDRSIRRRLPAVHRPNAVLDNPGAPLGVGGPLPSDAFTGHGQGIAIRSGGLATSLAPRQSECGTSSGSGCREHDLPSGFDGCFDPGLSDSPVGRGKTWLECSTWNRRLTEKASSRLSHKPMVISIVISGKP